MRNFILLGLLVALVGCSGEPSKDDNMPAEVQLKEIELLDWKIMVPEGSKVITKSSDRSIVKSDFGTLDIERGWSSGEFISSMIAEAPQMIIKLDTSTKAQYLIYSNNVHVGLTLLDYNSEEPFDSQVSTYRIDAFFGSPEEKELLIRILKDAKFVKYEE